MKSHFGVRFELARAGVDSARTTGQNYSSVNSTIKNSKQIPVFLKKTETRAKQEDKYSVNTVHECM